MKNPELPALMTHKSPKEKLAPAVRYHPSCCDHVYVRIGRANLARCERCGKVRFVDYEGPLPPAFVLECIHKMPQRRT